MGLKYFAFPTMQYVTQVTGVFRRKNYCTVQQAVLTVVQKVVQIMMKWIQEVNRNENQILSKRH